MNKLERLQLRILKIIFNTNSSEIHKFMKENGLLPLSKIYLFKLLSLGHTIIHNSAALPEYFKDKYKTKIYLTLRNRCDFLVPFYRTTIGQRRLDYRLAIEWNKLPTDIKSINKNKSFKHRLKVYLLDYAFL